MSENYRIRKIHGRLQRAGGSGVKDNPRKLLPLSLNIYRFRLMKSPFLQNLDELPGPVWLFGAYGMTRLGEWSFALLMQCVNGNLRLDGLTAGMQLLGLAGALLPGRLFQPLDLFEYLVHLHVPRVGMLDTCEDMGRVAVHAVEEM